MTAPPRKLHSPGTYLVLGLVALGLIAGVIAVTYWRGVAQRTWPQTQPGNPAGPAAWDPKKARAELEAVQQRLNDVDEQHPLKPVIQEARLLVERYPRYSPARITYGQALLRDRQVEAGYVQLKLGLDLDKQQPDVQLFAGSLAVQLNRLEDAARHFEMAVNLAPREAINRVHLANVQISLGELERARQTLLEAILVDSSVPESYATMADLYVREKKLDLAIDQLAKAAQFTPASQPEKRQVFTLNQAMLLRRANRPQEALQVIESLPAKVRTDQAVMADTATCWSMMGKFDEAARVYEKEMAQDPTRWQMAAEAARWRIKAGDHDAAKKYVELIRVINPRLPVIAELEKQLK